MYKEIFKKNLKKLIVLLICVIFSLIAYVSYIDLQKKNEIKISEKYTQAVIYFKKKKKYECKLLLENIIGQDHKFYSPLALYFIIDNELETDT